MWTLKEAIELIQEIEPKFQAAGFHVGLTGSVVFKGESKKDLDLIVYPHDYDAGRGFDVKAARKLIAEIFSSEWCDVWGPLSKIRDDKKVAWISAKGKRIDFFFLA